METYRSKSFPVISLVGCALVGAFLNQWVLVFIGLGAFIYFQFFKSDR